VNSFAVWWSGYQGWNCRVMTQRPTEAVDEPEPLKAMVRSAHEAAAVARTVATYHASASRGG